MKLFTIGHSNHSIEAFIELLKQHGVTAVGDVRSNPYSRRFPYFNQSSLKNVLKTADVAYVFLGQELGARPNDPGCYEEGGQARYELIASTTAFAQGLDRVILGAERHQIVLMCAEQDPIICHRAILVCQHLRMSGLEIQHILKNGNLEPHKHLEDRLLKLHGLDQSRPASHRQDDKDAGVKQLQLFDLDASNTSPDCPDQSLEFKVREESIQKAYKLQGDRIAYVEEHQAQPHEQAS